MGYIRRPSYFKDFHCISSKCTDSCCWHWEIDIDDDTLQYYNQVPGEFGQRLRQNIMPANGETDEPAHFIQDKKERCPFLNSCNLCDIFIRLGEKHLSYICTHHPRYYDWLLDGQEAGLGLCCEEAARLILQETGYPAFELTENSSDGISDSLSDGPSEDFSDADLQLEQAFEHRLINMREELFGIIKPETPADFLCAATLDEKMDSLYTAALPMQEECDSWLFPEETVPETPDSIITGSAEQTQAEISENRDTNASTISPEISFSWSHTFWQEDYLNQLLDYYLKLEINDPMWWKLLRRVKEQLPVLLPRRREFLTFYRDRLYEYEQLLIYFLYRHFLKAREDLLLTEKVVFALISVSIIQLLDLERWLACGTLTLKEQIDICKLYSKEIEYDEDNTRLVSLFQPASGYPAG